MIQIVLNTSRLLCLGFFLLINSMVFGFTLIEDELVTDFAVVSSLSANNEDGAIYRNGLKNGYKFIIEPGYQHGVGKGYRFNRLKLDVINGYQIGPHFSAGLGVGARYFADAQALLLPFFIDVRTTILNKPVSPYVAMAAGYTIDASNDFKEVGLFIHPTAGVSIKIAPKSAFHFGVGYEVQKIGNRTFGIYYIGIPPVDTSAITVNFGFSF